MIQAFLRHNLNDPYNAGQMKSPLTLNDARRRRYLREAGIALYWPRRRLAGAGPSRRYHGDARTVTDTLSGTDRGTDNAPIPEPADLSGLRDQLQGPPVSLHTQNGPAGKARSPAEAATDPAPAESRTSEARKSGQSRAAAEETLTFRFTCFLPDQRLMVLAAHEESRLTTGSLQMLQRILTALNSRYGNIELHGEPFQWPLDPSMPADLEGARQMVGAFLRRRCGRQGVPYLLALMDEPPLWLFPAEYSERAQVWQEMVHHPGLDMQVIRVPSLKAMAQDSAIKRPAWEAMKPLIAPLAGS
ncbi:MAG: hypothetical protein ACQETO_08830 [Pseudomonadota bacterium]